MQHPWRAALDAAPFFDIERDAAVAMASRMAATIDEQWRTRCGAAGVIARQMGRGR